MHAFQIVVATLVSLAAIALLAGAVHAFIIERLPRWRFTGTFGAVAITAVAALWLASGRAFADTGVTLAPLYSTLNEALATLLAGLVTLLVTALGAWLRRHFKFLSQQTDAVITSGFNKALQNGVNIATNSLEQYEGEHSTVAVKSWIAAKAAQYAIDHNPDYLKRFVGVTPEDAARKALAYLQPLVVPEAGKVVVGGQTVVLGAPSPANVDEKSETAALNVSQGVKA